MLLPAYNHLLTAPSSFRLMDLPPELRLLIYEFAVDVKLIRRRQLFERTCASYDNGMHRLLEKNARPGWFYPWRTVSGPTERSAILAASREVRKEALPVFYRTQNFAFLHCSMLRVLRWVVMVGDGIELKHIKSVVLPVIGTAQAKEEDVALMALSLLRQVHGFSLDVDVGNKRYEWVMLQLECLVEERIAALSLQVADVEGKSVHELLEMVRPWWVKPLRPADEEYDSEYSDDDYEDEDDDE